LPLRSEFATVRRPAERPSAVFVGQISALRGAAEMVSAMGKVGKFSEARLILVGETDVPDLLTSLSALPGWERVIYRGWQHRAAVEETLSQSSVGLVLYHPFANAIASQPNKLFEYMAAGLPVIASDFPLWRALVVDNGCGLCVPPHDIDAIARAIEWIFEHPAEADAMGRRGQALVQDEMNWEREENALLALYERLVRLPHKTLEGCL
jgi:glycosyltransferase involved in cell wall biosynthesis